MVKTLGINLIDQRLSQMDPTDLKGLPYVGEDGYTHYAMPGFLPRVDRDGEFGVLFLDELNTATPAMQAAGYQLILDRRLGDYVLPDGWVVNAAGNRAEDRAISIRMSTATGTRFGHIDFDVDNDEWKLWAKENNIHHDIISFLNYRPALLHDMDVNKRTFPCPRTWESVNKHMPYTTPDTEFNTYMAFIGEGAAGEFSAFRKLAAELPEFEQILAEPKHVPVPDNTSVLHAVAGLMAVNTTEDNFGDLMKYVRRMPLEFQTVYIIDASNYVPEIGDHKDFTTWTIDNHNTIV